LITDTTYYLPATIDSGTHMVLQLQAAPKLMLNVNKRRRATLLTSSFTVVKGPDQAMFYYADSAHRHEA